MSKSIQRKVNQVRRRLNFSRFLSVTVWTLSLTLLSACIGLFLDRLGLLKLDALQVLAVAAGAGLLLAAAWSYFTRLGALDAAIELDHAFGLRERTSTLVTLPESSLAEPVAAALQADVLKRTENLRVGERVPIRLPRYTWVPCLPLIGLLVLGFLVGPLDWLQDTASAKTVSVEEQKRVAKEAELLSQAVAKKKEELPDSALGEELKELTTEIENASKDIALNKKMGAKEASLKLSELSKSIEAKRKDLEANQMIERNLSKMHSLDDGPGKKLGNALKQGDFKEALKQLGKLQQQLEKGDLKPEEKKQLAKQLAQIQQQLQQLADLQKRRDQLEKNLPPEMLKQELAKLAKDAEQLKQLQELAQKLGQCSKCMGKDGKGLSDQQMKELQQAMAGAQQVLEQLRQEAEAREMLDNMINQLAQCQAGMCQGQQPGNGNGMGKGRGQGERPEQESDFRSREKRDRAELRKGEVFVIGRVKGNNFRGDSAVEIREAVANAARASDEAVTRQHVPRDYQEHTREYFDKLNDKFNE